MNLFLGVTDNDWYDYHRANRPSEVNFWRPSGQGFAALNPGEPFLFKLKAPRSAIAGGGFFVRFTRLPLTLTWDVFGLKNGAPDFSTFSEMIRGLRSGNARNPSVGCIILTAPFFFEEADWIPVPDSFAHNIVTGKTYDTTIGDGTRLWEEVRFRLESNRTVTYEPDNADVAASPQVISEEVVRYGSEYVARNRLGQSAFRAAVTDAYGRRCAFTGEKTLPALQASHIKPYAVSGPHRVDNGLLLRADVHQLFDSGYITLTSDYRVEVSDRIAEEFQNGREYYTLHGTRLPTLPDRDFERPGPEFIRHHNESIFIG